MADKRKTDRRNKSEKVPADRRKGPRRLTCDCGGKVDAEIKKDGSELFICLRCGKKY